MVRMRTTLMMMIMTTATMLSRRRRIRTSTAMITAMMMMVMMMMMMIAVISHDLMMLLCSRLLEGKLQEAKAKKDTLKARAASAKTSKQLNEMLEGLGDSSNSYVAFEKMEEKVIAMEAESEAIGMLGTTGSGDSLEAKFALLEGTDTDAELVSDHLLLPGSLLPSVQLSRSRQPLRQMTLCFTDPGCSSLDYGNNQDELDHIGMGLVAALSILFLSILSIFLPCSLRMESTYSHLVTVPNCLNYPKAAMKKKMAGGDSAGSLPAGRPIKDAIDMELEELR